MNNATPVSCCVRFNKPDAEQLIVQFEGTCRIGQELPQIGDFRQQLESGPDIRTVSFDTRKLAGWDSVFLVILHKIITLCRENNIQTDMKGLPHGVQRLMNLTAAGFDKSHASPTAAHSSFLSKMGDETVGVYYSFLDMLEFLGDVTVAFARMLQGKARFRRIDLLWTIQECGVQALPIVSLISLLVGLILAFVGAIQLITFGAQIYVAGLVGIAMVRVMGAVMTGVIMSGRTGAAYAAQLGTMQVNEEIDALTTMGISPIEFLVLPRMIALCLMMPLLCLYANLMGILGGMIVGVGMLDLNLVEYYNMTRDTVSLNDFWVGLFQSVVFGVLVALAGCLRGMQCGRSASAVGEAATSAVVMSIVNIVVATAIITVICNVLGI